MVKRWKQALLAVPVVLSLLVPNVAYAATQTYTTETVNTGQMGQVAIELREYELDAQGKEIPYQNEKVVLPGQHVDKIVRISNLGNDAWIRIKAEFLADEGIRGVDHSRLILANDKWVRVGDYYYYTAPVPRGQSVDFIKGFTVPTEINENASGKHFSIHVTSDAVQERNFNPDFTSEDPWFGTLIEQRIYEPFDIDPGANDTFSVIFKDGAEGFVKPQDDFFHNWGTMLPGDTLSGEVLVGNNYNRVVEIFFNTETIADDELLQQLHITIQNGDTVIYEGPLSGTVDKVSLGKFKKGQSTTLKYTVHVPEELRNKFALTETKTKWVFSAKLNDSYTGGSKSSSSKDKDPTPEKPGVITIPPDAPNVTPGPVPTPGGVGGVDRGNAGAQRFKTGDTNTVLFACLGAGLLGIVLIALLITSKKKRDKDD